MGEEKNHALDLLNNCGSYSFIGDKSTGLFHAGTCKIIAAISPEHIQGCGKNPEKAGFKPCIKCLPERTPEFIAKSKPHYGRQAPVKSKATIMREQLTRLCTGYGMHIKYKGSFAFITTIAGEWFFDFCDRPIKLHHQNSENSIDLNGNVKYFHVQQYSFSSPAHAVAYIYRHEWATVKRIMKQSDDGENNG